MDLAALLTGIAGIITTGGGILLAVRVARNRERVAAKRELEQVSGMLADERAARIECERSAHRLRLILARAGLLDE